jgi:hypothetical protein
MGDVGSIRRAVYNEEERLRDDLSIERFFGTDTDGRILVRKTGNEKSVLLTGNEMLRLFLYCPLNTHSHPDIYPHSINDIVTAYIANTIEDRVVTQEGTYVMYPPEIEWTEMAINHVLKSFFDHKHRLLSDYVQLTTTYDTIASNLHLNNPFREMREKIPRDVYLEIWKAVAVDTGIIFYFEPSGYYVARKIPPRKNDYGLDEYYNRHNYGQSLIESYKLDRDIYIEALNSNFNGH